MKKVICVVMLVAFFMAVPGISFAEHSTETEGSMKHHKDMKRGGTKGMSGMMMKDMMGKEIVASGDGGVIVLVGNKLLKYDKDLNLVKEVRLS